MEDLTEITLKKLQKTVQEFQKRYGKPDIFKAHPDCVEKFYSLLSEMHEKANIDITLTQAFPHVLPSKTLPEDRAVWATAEYTLLFDFSKTPVEIIQITMPEI